MTGPFVSQTKLLLFECSSPKKCVSWKFTDLAFCEKQLDEEWEHWAQHQQLIVKQQMILVFFFGS